MLSGLNSIFNDPQVMENFVLYSLVIIAIILASMLVVYFIRSEKFQKLYNYTNKEAKLLAKLKNTYETELKTFANLVDEITFPIWQRNKNLDIIYCNSRFCEVTGEIRENIIKKGETELFRDSKDFAAKALKTGKVQVMEQKIIIGGSSTLNQVVEIPISDNATSYSSKNGTIGFALNLAELQTARERLKSSMELQKKLLDSLNSAVAIYGVNQKLEYYNHAFVDLWKLDEDWLATNPTYGEILEQLREKRRLPEQSDFASFKRDNINMFSNLIRQREDYYYLSDGRVLKVIIIPYQSRGLLFYYEDLTSQLALERSYNTLLSVQKHTLDNLNEGVAVFREDGKLALFNPKFINLWGFADSFLRSEPHISEVIEEMMVLFSEETKGYKEELPSRLNNRSASEHRITRKDGVIILERFTPLPDGATLITHFDVTDKENAERSLRAERKAYEEADKIKTNFLGNVSYELRSPLTSIMGFAELMLAGIGGKMEDKAKGYSQDILNASLKLKQLIDNIIDISTMDAGYDSLDIKEVNILEIIDPILSDLKTSSAKRKVSVSGEVARNVDTIIADKPRLQEAIRALVNFLISISSAGGRIELHVSKKGKLVKFEISEESAVMPENELPQIFDQFYKIHSGNSNSSGLGPYFAKKIIDLHSGSIKVESSKTTGTKFTFDIPC